MTDTQIRFLGTMMGLHLQTLSIITKRCNEIRNIRNTFKIRGKRTALVLCNVAGICKYQTNGNQIEQKINQTNSS
jgi:hypothetical protein